MRPRLYTSRTNTPRRAWRARGRKHQFAKLSPPTPPPLSLSLSFFLFLSRPRVLLSSLYLPHALELNVVLSTPCECKIHVTLFGESHGSSCSFSPFAGTSLQQESSRFKQTRLPHDKVCGSSEPTSHTHCPVRAPPSYPLLGRCRPFLRAPPPSLLAPTTCARAQRGAIYTMRV